MKVVIIGTGYVGLVSGVCFAEIGHNVVCVDTNPDKVSMINDYKSPIHEDSLDELLFRNISNKRLVATTDLASAIIGADITMIAVGTPFDGQNIDLGYVRQAAVDIANVLQNAKDYHVVCVKSTVVPGTTEQVVGNIIEENSNRTIGVNVGIAMNPEFLAEGTAVKDFMHPDRIVVGVNDSRTAEVMSDLYSPFENVDTIFTSPSTAEMIKYTANSFLATVISFSNEIANLCSVVENIDVVDVMRGVHTDKRLSPILPQGRIVPGLLSFLHAGTGFGGSCFPKDIKALAAYGKQLDQPLKILESVIEVNRNQPMVTVDILENELGSLKGKRVAILGLSFKPGTDDIRESPAIAIIKRLLNEEMEIAAHDPIAINNMKKIFPSTEVDYFDSMEKVVQGVDAVLLVTSWPEYDELQEILYSKQILFIDGRRFLDKDKFSYYRGIGLNQATKKMKGNQL